MTVSSPVKFDRKYLDTPENVFSPGYFWIINGVMEEEKLFKQLDDMAAKGAKSVCFHPFPKQFRPNLMPSEMSPDYLTDKYMDMVLKVMDHAEKLGMNAWLYDEGGWPSGRCLGYVAAANPQKFQERFKQLEPDGTISDGTMYGSSMLEKGTVDKFIELTHEKWAAKCGRHFGRTIKFAFTDEPAVWSYIPGKTMAWGTDFAECFQAQKGYDIMPHIREILSADEPSDEVAKVRIDYCDVRANLFVKRFFKPIQDWCHQHGLLSGGHLNGEDEPMGNIHYGYGHILRSMRAMDVPGVDVVWRQLNPGQNNRPFPRYASSAAHHIGSKYAMAELFCIFGDGMSPSKMKWLIDYNLVRGINILVFGYYIYDPAKGFMASLHPNFNCNSVWDYMEPLHKYSASVCSVLSEGRPCAEIAVFYDIHAIWTGGQQAEAAVQKHLEIARKMDELQQDYDFIDDEQIASAEIIADGHMVIGKMSYDTIVLPTSKWLTGAAKAKLDEFKQNGGKILDGDNIDKAAPTCLIKGEGKEYIRVTKRLFADGVAAYFFVNESEVKSVAATVAVSEKSAIAKWRQQDGALVSIDSTDGTFNWTFEPCESLMIFTGVMAEAKNVRKPVVKSEIRLDNGWTLRKLEEFRAGKERLERVVCNEKATKAELGDWRRYFAEDFSGKAVYEVAFELQADCMGTLDLGRVCSCADVRLNGEKLPMLSLGPFRYEVKLQKGNNRLEIIVANTMANALNADNRARIFKAWPPVSQYNEYALQFNGLEAESGLFGPVVVKVH